MSIKMKNLLTHLQHPNSTKDYQVEDEPDAIKISEYWGRRIDQNQKTKNQKSALNYFHQSQILQINY